MQQLLFAFLCCLMFKLTSLTDFEPVLNLTNLAVLIGGSISALILYYPLRCHKLLQQLLVWTIFIVFVTSPPDGVFCSQSSSCPIATFKPQFQLFLFVFFTLFIFLQRYLPANEQPKPWYLNQTINQSQTLSYLKYILRLPDFWAQFAIVIILGTIYFLVDPTISTLCKQCPNNIIAKFVCFFIFTNISPLTRGCDGTKT